MTMGGAVISLIAMVGGAMGGSEAGAMSMLFGVGAVVLLPICYGGLGFITSLIGAAIYNVVVGLVGGLELDVQ